MGMTIVVYNILDGGTGRADPIVEVIAAQKADVAVLLDATDADVVHRLAWRLRMEPVVGNGMAVLSRRPMGWSVNRGVIEGKGFGWLEAQVDGVRVMAAQGAKVGELVVGEGVSVVAGSFAGGGELAGFERAEPGGHTFPTSPVPVSRDEQVYVRRGVGIASARIETDRLATYASDHYPMVVRLNVG
jgi:hypothetical protein